MPHWLFFFTPAAFQNRLNIKIPIEILLCNEGDDSQILYNNELGASFQSLSNTKESSLCEISCYKKRLIFNWNLRQNEIKIKTNLISTIEIPLWKATKMWFTFETKCACNQSIMLASNVLQKNTSLTKMIHSI